MKKIFFGFVLACFSSHPVWAGGPISVAENGTAAKWDGSISLHPESGTCGTFDNSQMVDKIEENVALWEDVTGVILDFTVTTGAVAENVTSDNYTDYFVDSSDDAGLNDSLNPVVFDDDGAIVNAIFGAGSSRSVLGFAGPDGFNSSFTEIVDGQAFFNCRCLAGNLNCSGVLFTEDDLDFTMTHEIGHMIGLDHTQVNQALAEGDCDTNVDGDCDDVPTMYPQSVDAGDQITPQADDVAALRSLYGTTYLSSNTYSITGTVVDANGDDLRCVDIQAVTGDTADTIATVSGVYAPNDDLDGDGYTDGAEECLSGCGDFVLRGLDPSKTYEIVLKAIDSGWTGGSSISPCGNGQPQDVVGEISVTTVSSGDQSAGTTLALGNVDSTDGSSGGGGSGGGSSGGSGGGGCNLAPKSTGTSAILLFAVFLSTVVFVKNKVSCR